VSLAREFSEDWRGVDRFENSCAKSWVTSLIRLYRCESEISAASSVGTGGFFYWLVLWLVWAG
jgi:hypothetical protein